MKFETVTLTRQQAARAEIDTAIELLFEGGSPVAIDVLAWAAVEMMRGIAEHRGLDTFHGRIEERVRPEYLKEWRRIHKEHYNFFKHADRDPDRVADSFRPEATTYALFGACMDYDTLFNCQTLAMMSYGAWFLARHPTFVLPEYADQFAPFADHLDDPAGRSFRDSLLTVASLYRSAKRNPDVVSGALTKMGARFEP